MYLIPRVEEAPTERRHLKVVSTVNIAMIGRLDSLPPVGGGRGGRRRRE